MSTSISSGAVGAGWRFLLALLLCGAGSAAADTAVPCADTDPVPGLETYYGTAWGIDHRNTREQPRASLRSDNAARLSLKWTYRLSSTTPRSYPLVTEDTVFIGDGGRGVVALDRDTGCERWVHEHEGPISSAILPATVDGRPALLFNDRRRGVFAIDARNGELIWHAAVEDEPVPWYSGTPLVTDTTVFVPVASMEVGLALNPFYGCCTTSGGMAAFDLNTGAKLWYLPTIEEEAKVTGRHFWFVEKHGPSGAPVWGAPSYDPKRGLLFFGTGQNYTHPTTDTSDAIFAVDAATGAVRWHRQFTANDAYTAACNNLALNHPNCADPPGPDVDFGAPTMLLESRSGRTLLVAGQKSADVHAMDPETGAVQWSTRLGRGGIIGGVHWGMAASESLGLLYVPISDKAITGFPSPGEPAPGLYALDIETGEQRWAYRRESRCPDEACEYGLSAAITVANDVVVAGSLDGFLEVFDARTGKPLWSHDAWRDYPAVNGGVANGGAFDAHGPMIADDLLIVTSGYGYVGRQRGGNALLVFQLSSDDD